MAKFHNYKDKEHVRKQSRFLKGTKYFVSEQFPRELVETRKKLFPMMIKARKEGKTAWMSYDKLFVDGRVVQP